MTDNHDYETPEKGRNDWHLPLNNNFEQIDTDVEVRDIESELGTYRPKNGAKFFATDTGAVYIGDGTEWHRAPTAAHDHDGDELAPAALDGDVVGRSEPIDSLAGNIYVTDNPDADPTENDGDIVFYVNNE